MIELYAQSTLRKLPCSHAALVLRRIVPNTHKSIATLPSIVHQLHSCNGIPTATDAEPRAP